MQGVAQNRDRLTYWVDFIKRRITPGFIVMGPHSNNADVWYDIGLVSAENPVQVPKLQIGVQMKDAISFIVAQESNALFSALTWRPCKGADFVHSQSLECSSL